MFLDMWLTMMIELHKGALGMAQQEQRSVALPRVKEMAMDMEPPSG